MTAANDLKNRLAAALEAGDLAHVQHVVQAQPARVHTFLTRAQPWGEEQWMPLHFAAHFGHAALAAWLLDQGVSVDCRTRYRTPEHGRATPLHLCARAGHLAVVELLLQRGAAVDVRDAQQLSPIGCAAEAAQPAVVARLIEAGAQLELADEVGRTPLHLAIDARAATGSEVDERANAAALALIEAGARVNAACPAEPAGYTPLHRCVTVGIARLPVAQRLIEAGADRHAFDPVANRTPLELAQATRDADAYLALLGHDE